MGEAKKRKSVEFNLSQQARKGTWIPKKQEEILRRPRVYSEIVSLKPLSTSHGYQDGNNLLIFFIFIIEFSHYSNEELEYIYKKMDVGDNPPESFQNLSKASMFILVSPVKRNLEGHNIEGEASSDDEDTEFLPEKKAILIAKPKTYVKKQEDKRERAQSFNVMLTESSLLSKKQRII
jgi:hypothetical protein